jgi:hypothetical protein
MAAGFSYALSRIGERDDRGVDLHKQSCVAVAIDAAGVGVG